MSGINIYVCTLVFIAANVKVSRNRWERQHEERTSQRKKKLCTGLELNIKLATRQVIMQKICFGHTKCKKVPEKEIDYVKKKA